VAVLRESDSDVDMLDKLPKRGLILDLGDNPGGFILAAERMLQLFTPNAITPTEFAFARDAADVGADADFRHAVSVASALPSNNVHSATGVGCFDLSLQG
jgi:hypothetical protein